MSTRTISNYFRGATGAPPSGARVDVELAGPPLEESFAVQQVPGTSLTVGNGIDSTTGLWTATVYDTPTTGQLVRVRESINGAPVRSNDYEIASGAVALDLATVTPSEPLKPYTARLTYDGHVQDRASAYYGHPEMQAQIDQIAQGATLAELSQARVDDEAYSWSTLKERLDAGQRFEPVSPASFPFTGGATYALGDIVIPSSAAYVGRMFRVTTAGIAGSSEPTWPTSGTVTSGAVVFTAMELPAIRSRLQGVVRVDDFGADPTGAVDSYDAFVMAIKAAGTTKIIDLGIGQYKLSNYLTWTGNRTFIGRGAKVLLSSTTLPLVYLTASGSLYWDGIDVDAAAPITVNNSIFKFEDGITDSSFRNMKSGANVTTTIAFLRLYDAQNILIENCEFRHTGLAIQCYANTLPTHTIRVLNCKKIGVPGTGTRGMLFKSYGIETARLRTWTANTVYALNEVVDATKNAPRSVDTSKKVFRVTTAGTSGATEPTWGDTGTTTSGTAVLTAIDPETEWKIGRDILISGSFCRDLGDPAIELNRTIRASVVDATVIDCFQDTGVLATDMASSRQTGIYVEGCYNIDVINPTITRQGYRKAQAIVMAAAGGGITGRYDIHGIAFATSSFCNVLGGRLTHLYGNGVSIPASGVCEDITVRGVYIAHLDDGDGVAVHGSTTVRHKRITVSDCQGYKCGHDYSPFFTTPGDSATKRPFTALVFMEYVDEPKVTGNSAHKCGKGYQFGVCQRAQFQDNRARECLQGGLMLTTTSGAVIENNLFENNGRYNGEEWAADYAYVVNDLVYPTTDNGRIFICTTSGTSGATEPTWALSGTVNDGTAVWTASRDDSKTKAAVGVGMQAGTPGCNNNIIRGNVFRQKAPLAGTGTVTTTIGSGTVAGVGTTFLQNIEPGDLIVVGGETVEVSEVASNTALYTKAVFAGANTGAAFATYPSHLRSYANYLDTSGNADNVFQNNTYDNLIPFSDSGTRTRKKPTRSNAATTPSDSISPGTWLQGDFIENIAPAGATPTTGWSCTASGTFGALVGITADATTGDDRVTVNSAVNLRIGQYITIVGVSGTKRILKINGCQVIIDVVADATVTGAAVAYGNPTFVALVAN